MSDDGFFSSIYPQLKDFFVGAQGGVVGALVLRKYRFPDIAARVIVGGVTAMYCNQAIGGFLGLFFATSHDFAVYISGVVGMAFSHGIIKIVVFLSERELK